jgi:Skp family chaperone for outer membrane proteins
MRCAVEEATNRYMAKQENQENLQQRFIDEVSSLVDELNSIIKYYENEYGLNFRDELLEEIK